LADVFIATDYVSVGDGESWKTTPLWIMSWVTNYTDDGRKHQFG